MMMNVPANFYLIWTKNKEMAGGGSMWGNIFNSEAAAKVCYIIKIHIRSSQIGSF